jgi:arabinofuranan 3-O-arabinosyltransferase
MIAAAPGWLIALRPGPGWSDLPGYWRQAASWLAAQDPTARTLLVPGSGFGVYTWGRTIDEPIQALAGAPWAVRSQIPLGSEGNTRVMDTVEEVLSGGEGSPGLAAYLARNGYRYLLLRNDLDRTRRDVPPIAVLRQALARSTGIRLAASFGPQLSPPDASRSPVDDGEQPPPAIEIYDVGRSVPLVRTVDARDVAAVSGGPESMLPLLEQGLIAPDRPAVLAGDLTAHQTDLSAGHWLVTDGLRRRERNVGRVHDNLSHTLAADEAPRQDRAALDILPFSGTEHQTVAVYRGVRAVTASTSASYADVIGEIEPHHLPYAAIDGDPRTAWQSSTLRGPQGEWFEVSLDTPRRVTEVRLQFVDDIRIGWPVTRFRLTTDHGSVDYDVTPGGAGTYPAPAGGLVTRVRVTVLDVIGGRTTGNVGIRELTVPGLAPQRALRVPTDQVTTGPATGADAPAFAFTRGYQGRPSCYVSEGAVRCDPDLARAGEEPHGIDRLFRTPVAARYGLSLTAVAAIGADAPLPPALLEADASSWLTGDPRVGPHAAIDGDPTTGWLADVGDTVPTFRLRWTDQRRLDRLDVRFTGRPISSRPTAVRLITPAGERAVHLGPDGSGSFEPVVTDRVDIVVESVEPRVLDRRGIRVEATAGFAEVTFPALAGLRPPTPAGTPFSVPCGQGPTVELDGVRFATSVSGTLGDFTAGQPLPVRICDLFAADALDLTAGEHRLRTESTANFVIQDATLRPYAAGRPIGGATTPARDRPTTVQRWGPASRLVQVGPGEEGFLVIAENANAGWRASLGGRPLATARIDGWQQAWVVPAGVGGTVRLTFAPDRQYREGLATGGSAALAVLVLAVLPALALRRRPAGWTRPAPVPAGGYWLTVLIAALVAALAGVLGVVLLIAGALVRQLYPRALARIAFGGALVATAVAVTGRLVGQGQDWAYGAVAQAAMLTAICAGVAAAAVRIPGGADLDAGTGPGAGPDAGLDSRTSAGLDSRTGAELDSRTGGDEQRGDDGGRGGDLGDGVAEPPPDQARLDGDGQPHGEDRPDVAARDPGEQQQLGDGEQRPGQGEQPQRGDLPAVAGAAEERQ